MIKSLLKLVEKNFVHQKRLLEKGLNLFKKILLKKQILLL